MKHGAAIALAVTALFAAGEVAACTVDVELFGLPETLQKERQLQQALWDRSQWVSLAKVDKQSWYFGRVFRIRYRTIVPLKGENHPKFFSKTIWLSDWDRECGFFPPELNTHVIMYSNPKSGFQKYLPWVRPAYTWYGTEYVTDRRVATSLRSAANRLKSSNK
ncbi:hypothetical protein GCM10009093_01370 [Brevundimonas terrae]|uniref:Lipoprotein n=1 Tax=Brevundimonas terrae TaxID=363631 RepID=A0ABP3HRQ4_9CAUL|nr:hypothetical protein [Brevundimonas terrae]NIJ27497.1 hypothetical protein [Brevundimonas terrae]